MGAFTAAFVERQMDRLGIAGERAWRVRAMDVRHTRVARRAQCPIGYLAGAQSYRERGSYLIAREILAAWREAGPYPIPG